MATDQTAGATPAPETGAAIPQGQDDDLKCPGCGEDLRVEGVRAGYVEEQSVYLAQMGGVSRIEPCDVHGGELKGEACCASCGAVLPHDSAYYGARFDGMPRDGPLDGGDGDPEEDGDDEGEEGDEPAEGAGAPPQAPPGPWTPPECEGCGKPLLAVEETGDFRRCWGWNPTSGRYEADPDTEEEDNLGLSCVACGRDGVADQSILDRME